MSNWNDQFWKPDKETVVSLKKFRQKQGKKNPTAKQRKGNKQKRWREERENARKGLIKYFKLNKYATNIAISICIHNESGLPLPETDKATRRFIVDYWKGITHTHHDRYKHMSSDKFYSSKKWRELRYIALKQTDGKCSLCGASSSDGVQLHVDHIKSRSKYPQYQFDLNNLQVLCEDCNMGKSNYDDTDWR